MQRQTTELSYFQSRMLQMMSHVIKQQTLTKQVLIQIRDSQKLHLNCSSLSHDQRQIIQMKRQADLNKYTSLHSVSKKQESQFLATPTKQISKLNQGHSQSQRRQLNPFSFLKSKFILQSQRVRDQIVNIHNQQKHRKNSAFYQEQSQQKFSHNYLNSQLSRSFHNLKTINAMVNDQQLQQTGFKQIKQKYSQSEKLIGTPNYAQKTKNIFQQSSKIQQIPQLNTYGYSVQSSNQKQVQSNLPQISEIVHKTVQNMVKTQFQNFLSLQKLQSISDSKIPSINNIAKMMPSDQKHYYRLYQIQPYSDRREMKVRIHFLEMSRINSLNLNDLNDKFKSVICEWLGIVYRVTASICWSSLLNKFLSFDETKVLFTQNIIFNYIELMKDFHEISALKASELENSKYMVYLETTIVKLINEQAIEILRFLCKQYPQTRIQAPNMALRSAIPSLDQKGRIQYDLLKISKVKLEYRQDRNYSPQIMTFLNYLIDVTDIQYPVFEKYVWQLFQGFQGFENEGQILNEKNNNSFTVSKQQVQQLKKSTKYAISRKIPKNTVKYSEQDIQNGVLFIRSNHIMRILIKWYQQLIEIVEHPAQKVKQWYYSFKNKNNQQYHAPFIVREALYNKIIEQRGKLFKRLEQIKMNCFQVQGYMTRPHYISMQKLDYLPQQQISIGLFASNMKKSLSSYVYMYLAETIHFLLGIPLKIKASSLGIKQKFFENKIEKEIKQINLVTFKSFDLLRCKCISSEEGILRIINQMKIRHELSKSQENSSRLCLIRVKDRMNKGTRDILINAQLKGCIPCEVQLSVTSQFQEKQNLLNQYNHFLYQLERSSIFGPLIQNISIWTNLEQRASFFEELIKKKYWASKSKVNNHRQICSKPNFKKFSGPMFCTNCQNFFDVPRTCIINVVCQTCQVKLCGQCWYEGMNQKGKKEIIFGEVFRKQFKQMLTQYKTGNSLEGFPQISFAIRNAYQRQKYKFIRKIKDQINNQSLITNVTFSKSKNIMLVNSYSNQKSINQRQKVKNMIVFALDRSYIQEISFDTLKHLVKSNSKIRILNFLFDTTYKTNLHEIYQQKKKEKLLNQIEKIVINHKIKKIIVIHLRQYNFLVLCQFQIEEDELKRKLNIGKNIRILVKQAQTNASVLALQYKGLTTQFDPVKILYRVEQRLFNALCRNLMKVFLDYGSIKQIGALCNFTNVTHFSISNNELQSLEGIQKLTKLRVFKFENNKVASLKPLAALHQLQILIGNNNQVQSLQGIQNLQHLKQITMYFNKIRTVKGIFVNKPQLETLFLRGNELDQFDFTHQLNSLRNLSLSKNPIRSICSFKNMPNLKILALSLLRLKSIPTEAMSNLQLNQLSMNQNQIEDLKGLEEQRSLQILSLNNNRITHLRHLQNLKLKQLNLMGNQIKVIKGIEHMFDTLLELQIRQNPIEDCGELARYSFICNILWTPQAFTAQARKEMQQIIGEHSKQVLFKSR